MKRLDGKKCACIDTFNAQLATEGLVVETVFTVSGILVVPLMAATNEMTRKKGEKKRRKILRPTFCPFCGGKYRYS